MNSERSEDTDPKQAAFDTALKIRRQYAVSMSFTDAEMLQDMIEKALIHFHESGAAWEREEIYHIINKAHDEECGFERALSGYLEACVEFKDAIRARGGVKNEN
jgi:hypothetical protein